ncbi:MAG: hypothetical protein Q4D04_10810 [Clostridia bacterium]|nr:hypothetical protein [Clostridia bacterium]
MKKALFAIFIAMTLFAIPALAEITVEFAGEFVITHPDDLETIELTPDDLSEGMVYCASSDDVDLYIWSGDMDGMTADELYLAWQDDEYLMNVSFRDLGSVRMLGYDIEEEGKGAVIAGVNDSYYEIICYYEYEDDDVVELARMIMDSISLK